MSAGFDRVIAALDSRGSKQRTDKPGHVLAQCPAHDDRNPSLSITDRGDRALVHCFAGCDSHDVVVALGMHARDLFDAPTTTYRYDNGREVRRSYGDDGRKRITQANTSAPVELFGLGRVRAAAADGQPVFVAEGEEDAKTILSAGHVGTSAPQGASNWHLCDYAPLIGARVYVVADNNDAGSKRGLGLAAHLERIGVNLAGVITSPVGDDVTDGVAAGLDMQRMRRESVNEYRARVGTVEQPASDEWHEGEPPEDDEHDANTRRRLVLTPASDIEPRPIYWLWAGRLALGTLGLLAGREGIGKSTLAYTIAADITRGTLDGANLGTPKSVLVAATEDSWAHTIVPRLMAAGADLARVYRVEVVSADDIHVGLSLPRDMHALAGAANEVGAALLLLDPLMSRLDGLDTHKDAEVRRALEPLVALADQANLSVLGLIHHNKSGAADPMQAVMGSRAFTAVARSVHTVVIDPDDDTGDRKLFGTPKNNLGRSDLPTLGYRIASHSIDTAEGEAWTGRLVWDGESAESIGSVMGRASDDTDKTATSDAAGWMSDYLAMTGGAPSADVKKEAAKAGHAESAVKRAAKRLRVVITSHGFPRVTEWSLPVGSQLGHFPRGGDLTELTDPTGDSGPSVGSVGSVGSRVGDVDGSDPTGTRPPATSDVSAYIGMLDGDRGA